MRVTLFAAVLLATTLPAQDPPRPGMMSKAEADAERGMKTRTIDARTGKAERSAEAEALLSTFRPESLQVLSERDAELPPAPSRAALEGEGS